MKRDLAAPTEVSNGYAYWVYANDSDQTLVGQIVTSSANR